MRRINGMNFGGEHERPQNYQLLEKRSIADLLIVHDGIAHADDFQGGCLFAAVVGKPIFRGKPTEADLQNPRVMVADVGGRFQPNLLNIDHHHDPDLPCSFVLMLDLFDLRNKFEVAFNWLDDFDLRDREGMIEVGLKYGLTEEQMLRLGSPIATSMINIFQQVVDLEPGDALYEVMAMIGRDMIEYAEAYGPSYKQMERAPIYTVAGGHRVIFVENERAAGVGDFVRRNTISVTISKQMRASEPNGWSIKRCGVGESFFDFRKIEGDPRINFVHANGFVAKTNRVLDVTDLLELITNSAIR